MKSKILTARDWTEADFDSFFKVESLTESLRNRVVTWLRIGKGGSITRRK